MCKSDSKNLLTIHSSILDFFHKIRVQYLFSLSVVMIHITMALSYPPGVANDDRVGGKHLTYILVVGHEMRSRYMLCSHVLILHMRIECDSNETNGITEMRHADRNASNMTFGQDMVGVFLM